MWVLVRYIGMDLVLGVIAAVVILNAVAVVALVRKYRREQKNDRAAYGTPRPNFLTRDDVTLAR